LDPLEVAGEGGAPTKINSFKISMKDGQTRLIFDAVGGRPTEVGPPSDSGISIFFSQYTTKIPDKVIGNSASAVKEIKFRRESGFLEVLFRDKNTPVTSKIVVGKKSDSYSLLLEFSAAPKKTSAEQPAEKQEKPVPVEFRKVDATDLFGAKSPLNASSLLAEGKKKLDTNAGKVETEKSGGKGQPFVDGDERINSLYKTANDIFESCSRNLVLCGQEVTEAYDEALRAGPNSSSAPLALYRTGFTASLMGNYSKAEKSFRYVLSQWPDNAVSSRCLIGMGDILNKKQAYLEAMEAFRAALRQASDKGDKAAAYFELGREFQILGASKDALEMLTQCSGCDPEFYTKKPEMIRIQGEAEFALGMYDKSKEHLLEYTNYQQSGHDQDMVLAKLAEIFLAQGDANLAKKMYGFLKKYYTDSEGDLISRIRRAEISEKTDPEEALRLYNDLCNKDLSPSLRRIVYLKMASLSWKKGTLERGLELMEEVFQGKGDTATGEMVDMREKILGDLVRKYYTEANYISVIQLHDKYRSVFDSMPALDVLQDIAESYGAVKFYSQALAIYDRLLSRSTKKNEDLYLKCALYALRIGDLDKSLQFCKQIQSDALDLKKSEILGHVACRDHRYADAVKFFSKFLQKQKDPELTDPDSLKAFGNALFEVKKFDEAIPVLQKGLERLKEGDADSSRSILIVLGKCYNELKQYSKAAETMELAMRYTKEEDKNELLYDISKAWLAAGQQDKAVRDLQEIVGKQHPFWAMVAEQQLNSIQMAQAQTH
jgi:tetratricopeptide (TPR) repeat protein